METLELQRETQYRKFKDTLFKSNQHVQDPDLDLDRSRLFINKIKDHRHSKVKEKHINKFKRLYFKCYGYHHNPNRHAVNINNIDHQNTLSRHRNVPSSISSTSTTTCNPTTVPAPPIAPTPSSSTTDFQPSTWAPTLQPQPYMYRLHQQMGNQPVRNPPHQGTIIHTTKRTQLCYHPQIPPIEAYITAMEQTASKLPAQEADEFRLDVNKILKQQQQHHNNQCNLNPSQCRAPYTTKVGQFQGGFHSGHGGGHGHHGPRRLHQ